MDEKRIAEIFSCCFSRRADSVRRCATGQGNYVFRVEAAGTRYIIRCSPETGAYTQTVHGLEKLAAAGVPVPGVLGRGRFQGYDYIVLSYLEGEDLGAAYPELSAADKRAIAREVVELQRRAGTIPPEDVGPGWSWRREFVDAMLMRARERIVRNGYFDSRKVDRLAEASRRLDGYFDTVRPTVYLDDISTKNLLIHDRRVSGIIDVDWIGVGDVLTYAALTNMALLQLGYDADYPRYLLEEMRVTDTERTAFLFYTLVFCVDFMGERGTCFLGRTVAVNRQIVGHLNEIYAQLWREWTGRRGAGDPR